jgi:hypothetical protein
VGVRIRRYDVQYDPEGLMGRGLYIGKHAEMHQEKYAAASQTG